MAEDNGETVLVIPRVELPALPEQAAWPWDGGVPARGWTWRDRAQAETDEDYLQLIPYVVLRNRAGQAWHYRRVGGDPRLVERLSCGLGGHVEPADARGDLVATAVAAARRELREELGDAAAESLCLGPPAAWIHERLTAVGRVHVGWLFVVAWPAEEPPQPAPGQPLEGRGFVDAAAVSGDERFELWSRLAAAFLLGDGR